MKTINEHDKKRTLDEINQSKERYIFKIWAVIRAKAMSVAALRDLSLVDIGPATRISNNYCYIGATKSHLNFIILDPIILTRVRNRFSIPLDKIDKAVITRSLILGKYLVKLDIGKAYLELDLSSVSIGTDLLDQELQIEKMIKLLGNLN